MQNCAFLKMVWKVNVFIFSVYSIPNFSLFINYLEISKNLILFANHAPTLPEFKQHSETFDLKQQKN